MTRRRKRCLVVAGVLLATSAACTRSDADIAREHRTLRAALTAIPQLPAVHREMGGGDFDPGCHGFAECADGNETPARYSVPLTLDAAAGPDLASRCRYFATALARHGIRLVTVWRGIRATHATTAIPPRWSYYSVQPRWVDVTDQVCASGHVHSAVLVKRNGASPAPTAHLVLTLHDSDRLDPHHHDGPAVHPPTSEDEEQMPVSSAAYPTRLPGGRSTRRRRECSPLMRRCRRRAVWWRRTGRRRPSWTCTGSPPRHREGGGTAIPQPVARGTIPAAGRRAVAWMCLFGLTVGGCAPAPAPPTARPVTSPPTVSTSPQPPSPSPVPVPAGVPVATFEGVPHAWVTATAGGGYVVVGRSAGRYQIDSVDGDGTRRWSKTYPYRTDTDADVQVGRSVVVVTQGNPARKEWPGSLVIHVLDTRSGRLLWSDDQPSFVSVAGAVYTSVCHGGQNNHLGDCRLSARDPRTGQRRWSIPTYASAQVGLVYPPGSLAAAPVSSYLVVVSYPTGYASQTVTTIDPRSGRPLGTSVRSIGWFSTDRVLIGVDRDHNDPEHGCKTVLTGWDPHGSGRLWRTTITGTVTGTGYCSHVDRHLVGDGQLAVLTSTGTTRLLSLTTGKTTWTSAVPGEPVLVGHGYVITATTGGGLTYHDQATHTVRWRTPGPHDRATLLHSGLLAVYDRDAGPYCGSAQCPTTTILNPATGSVYRVLPGTFVAASNQVIIITEAQPVGSQTSQYAVYTIPKWPGK